MKIGEKIRKEEYTPRIIPITLPEKIVKPEEKPIEVPNWPQKQEDPASVPAPAPEKEKVNAS
jgi:hypothetical protein